MTDLVISADWPEIRLWAQLAAIPPQKLADAWSDPERFQEHLAPEELARFGESWGRMTVLVWHLFAAWTKIAGYIPKEPN